MPAKKAPQKRLNQFDFIKRAELDMQSRPADWRAKMSQNLIPMSEMKKHATRSDAWVVLGGNVYDVKLGCGVQQ